MRLRLTVERHALPSTNIIWHIEKSSAPTIHFLLEKVNEVIPIESADQWGLEDYAVELKGSNGVNFECLHFQEVFKVFKEDDEVIIRPLLTRDLKVRRISGRHQISEDGKRLYDGMAFGRPLLKTPAGRPDIKIPPRKRARLMITKDDDDYQEENTERQMVLHADFEGIDSDSDDNEDFTPGQDDDEDMSDEDEDEAEDEDKDSSSELEDDSSHEDDDSISGDLKGLEEEIEETKGKQDEAGSDSGADSSSDSGDDVVPERDDSIKTKTKDVAEEGDPEDTVDQQEVDHDAYDQSLAQISDENDRAKIQQNNMSLSPRQSNPKKRPAEVLEDDIEDGDDSASDAEEENDAVRRFDQQGFPSGSISTGKVSVISPSGRRTKPAAVEGSKIKFSPEEETLSHGLTSTPFIDKEPVHGEVSSNDSSSSGSSDSSDEDDLDYDGNKGNMEIDDDDTSTSGSDSSDSDSDSSDDSVAQQAKKPASSATHGKANSTRSHDSTTSTSGSDSDSDESSDSDSSSDSSDEDDDIPEEVSSKSTPPMVQVPIAPGEGQTKTRKRNIRRRKTNEYERYLKTGILPAGTTFDEFDKSKITNETTPDEAEEKLRSVKNDLASSTNQTISASEEFNIQRQKLLDSLASGGVEVGNPSIDSPRLSKDATTESESHQTLLSLQKPEIVSTEAQDTRPSTAPENTADTQESPKAASASVDSPQSKLAPTRRAKLDLGAGRRMLFQAMGLKTPKTKDDEDKLRKDLMKDIKPLKPANTIADSAPNPLGDVENEDPEAWREKINYRAVECCQEDVELSEPPFPFKQRWDSQQQTTWSQGGKRKKNQREEPQYYQDSNTSKSQKRRKGKHNYADQQDYLDDSYKPSAQDDSMYTQDDTTQMTGIDDEGEINHQLLWDAESPLVENSQVPDDLVSLPEDMSSLPDLQDGAAKAGMVIAFRIMECSAATNWGPEITPYKTAIVIEVSENGSLDITLAIRDRIKPEFDETGARVHDPFMVVDDDDDGEDEDDGKRNVQYAELIEPKVIGFPLDSEQEKEAGEGIPLSKEGPSADESDTLSHERPSHDEEVPETQFTHVTETVLDSDAPEPNLVAELDGNNEAAEPAIVPESRIEVKEQDIAEEVESIIPAPDDQSTPISEILVQEPEQVEESLEPSKSTSSGEALSSIPDAQIEPIPETITEEQVEVDTTIPEPASIEDSQVPDVPPNAMAAQITLNEDAATQSPAEVDTAVATEPTLSEPKSQDVASQPIDTQISDFVESEPHAQIETDLIDTEAEAADSDEQTQTETAESKAFVAPESDIQMQEASPVPEVDNPSDAMPFTPAKQTFNGPEDVSTENSQAISHLIRDAGFRDSISSSVLKQIGPENIETPDAITFDRLRKDMAEIEQEPVPSPTFNGFGSSPSRQPDHDETLPHQEGNDSPQFNGFGSSPSRQETPLQPAAPESPNLFVSPYPKAPVPIVAADNSSDWESDYEEEKEVAGGADLQTGKSDDRGNVDESELTAVRSEEPQVTANTAKTPFIFQEETPSPAKAAKSTSPVKAGKAKSPLKITKSRSPVPRTVTRSPIGAPSGALSRASSTAAGKRKSFTMRRMPQPKAALLWESMAPDALKARSRQTKSPKPVPDTPMDDVEVDAAELRESVEQPKVSVNSSFTSVVTDAGRQPDFNFDDSTMGVATEQDISAQPSRRGSRQMPASRQGSVHSKKKSKSAAEDSSDSDSDFPSMRILSQSQPKRDKLEVCSQPLPPREKTAPVRARPAIKHEPVREVSADSEASAPKAVKKKQGSLSARSESSRPPNRASKPGFFPSASQPQSRRGPSQSQSQGSQRPAPSSSQPPSQMIDLTWSSEPESPHKKKSPPKKFRKPDFSDDESGPLKKAGKPALFRQSSGAGLKDSSQSHLNQNYRR